MKVKIIENFIFNPERLKIILGTDKEFLMVKYSASSNEAEKKVSKEYKEHLRDTFGCSTSILNLGKEDPDGCSRLVWINSDRMENVEKGEETLLHELTHFKQGVEKFLKIETWPKEIEARFMAYLFREARVIFK